MTATQSKSRMAQRRILFGIIVIAVGAFAVVLAIVLNNSSPDSAGTAGRTYADEVSAALAGAEAEIGRELVVTYDCGACHLAGDGSNSPLFTGIAELAADRRPPLSAEQYLYEAILYPGAHLVAGYTNAMPNNYDARLSQEEVGHIIAYLLTFKGANDA